MLNPRRASSTYRDVIHRRRALDRSAVPGILLSLGIAWVLFHRSNINCEASKAFSWTGRRTFVTGATGIVGSWLVKRLLDLGADVVTLVRDWDPRPNWSAAGTSSARTWSMAGSRTTTHSSGRSTNTRSTQCFISAPSRLSDGAAQSAPTFEANIRGSYNLLEACRVHRSLVTRVVVASSDKATATGRRIHGRHAGQQQASVT